MSELVKYEDDELSVVEKPPRDCQAVIKARDHMLGAVDLDGSLSDLVTVGKFIRIAYNGVAGDTDLQIAMREIGLEIAELCDDSGLTINKFRMTADSILTDLTGAYQFFLDDVEEMAITSIESVGDSAKQMAEAAEELCQRFKDESEKVLKVYIGTAEKKGMKEQTIPAAAGALLKLATFWKCMQQMCQELSSGKLEAFLHTAQRYEDPVKRLKAYQNQAIKRRAVKVYVSWVAMETVCDDYIKKIKVSSEELYSYLCENPTIEESKARIQLLCREFKERFGVENAKMEKLMRKM